MHGRIDPVVESVLTPCCKRMPYDCTCRKTRGLGGAVLNVFCKTGQGGGIDPTCSSKGGSTGSTPQLSVEQIGSAMTKMYKETSRPMNGGECGSVAKTLMDMNPAFKAYAVTTQDPYNKKDPTARGISHLVVSADGGKTFVDGQGVRNAKSVLKESAASDLPKIVPAEYVVDPKYGMRSGGYFKAADSPEKFEAGPMQDLPQRIEKYITQ